MHTHRARRNRLVCAFLGSGRHALTDVESDVESDAGSDAGSDAEVRQSILRYASSGHMSRRMDVRWVAFSPTPAPTPAPTLAPTPRCDN